jgi:hypothetical protein
MARAFKDSDEGMTVVTSDGDEVGTVAGVRGDTVHVKPETGLGESIRQRLGWGDDMEDTYELSHSRVQSFSGNKIHLQD